MKQTLLFLTIIFTLFDFSISQAASFEKSNSNCSNAISNAPRAMVQVTFQVNMFYEEVSTDGVHLAGSWQGDPWDPDAITMNPIGGGIYSATVSLESGTEYFYAFYNGSTVEIVPEECQAGFSDPPYRNFIPGTSDMVLDPVCFNYCVNCAPFHDVTLEVNMQYEAVSSGDVYVEGTFAYYSGIKMSSSDGIIWSTTVSLMEGSIPKYRFYNGQPQNGGVSESWPIPYPPCVGFEPARRYFVVPDSDVTIQVCFEYCSKCPNLLISEIASPSDDPYSGFFIELYNAGSETIDFDNLPIYLLQYSPSPNWQERLTGSLGAGDKFVIGSYDFEGIYGFAPDLESWDIYGLGDDAFFIYLGNESSWLKQIDAFGSVDEYGNATTVNYVNTKAVRLRPVTQPSPVYLPGQWHIPYTTAVAEMTPGAHKEDVNWTGTLNAYWNEKGNWDGFQGYIPDASFNVTVPQETNQPWIMFRDADCNNLTLQTGADLNVEQSMWVTVFGNLNVSAGTMTIHSDQYGEMGSLITYGSVAGNIHFLREISDEAWHLVSSPVVGTTADVFYDDFVQLYSENLGDWVDITSYLDPINTMQGYALWGVPSRNIYDFYGVPNTGNKSIGFSDNNTGWNLLGNPYPSAVDWDLVDIPDGMDNAIYYLNATTGSYVSYVNGTPNDQDLQYIPANQGFWVSASGSGTLTFNNNVRTHYPGALYYKNEEITPDYIELLAAKGADFDQTFIRFRGDVATPAFDGKYDAYKLMAPNQSFPQLFTYAGNDKLSINQLPEVDVMDLGFYCRESGTYTILLAELNGAANCLLEDLKTGQTQDLKLGNYSFAYSAGEPEKRFKLHFGPTSIQQNKAGESILIYSNGKQIIVSSKNVIQNSNLQVTDLSGRIVLEKTIDNQQTFSVNSGLQSGIYLVTLSRQGGVKTEKVIIE